MKNQEPTKPTGSLEDLFRHHLAEAAVSPRPHVWEQVDNALLLAQNQTYRRRLRATRWLAAASLLLAMLAGLGWWGRRTIRPAEMAVTAGSPATPRPGKPASASRPPAAPGESPLAREGVGANPAAWQATTTVAVTAAPSQPSNPQESADQLRRQLPSRASRRSQSTLLTFDQSSQPSGRARLAMPRGAGRRRAGLPGLTESQAGAGSGQLAAHSTRMAATGRLTPAASQSEPDALRSTGSSPKASINSSELALISATDRALALLPLSGTLVSLSHVAGLPLPSPLPPLPLAAADAPTQARRWRLGASYAAGVFQSNIDFARADLNRSYSGLLGSNSFALSKAAATEYQAQQRSGRSQRLRLQVSRRLRGHWSLETGLEVAQQESRSATSFAFTGEPVYDLGQPTQGGQLRPTSARYRTAGLPLELRYANSVKTGFSLYGRVGAIVSALLTSRTEVEGNPEATRTYSLLSASTPYRRVLGTARGAAGVQFRPVGHDYTLSLGPVAEGGLWSLNAHPAQGFFSQSRPYSFGLEAGVEFGRGLKVQ